MDIYEKQLVPFGLVRFGVAPDHPEVKVGISELRARVERLWSRCGEEGGSRTSWDDPRLSGGTDTPDTVG